MNLGLVIFWKSCYGTHSVRVANELGAGNGQAAKFAAKVSVAESSFISLFICVLVIALHDKIGYIFTSSTDVLQEVDHLSYLLGITILLNGVQPVLSGYFSTLHLLSGYKSPGMKLTLISMKKHVINVNITKTRPYMHERLFVVNVWTSYRFLHALTIDNHPYMIMKSKLTSNLV